MGQNCACAPRPELVPPPPVLFPPPPVLFPPPAGKFLKVSALVFTMLIARTLRYCRAPKITLMSNLPQDFTNRTVWFIFTTIVDKND